MVPPENVIFSLEILFLWKFTGSSTGEFLSDLTGWKVNIFSVFFFH